MHQSQPTKMTRWGAESGESPLYKCVNRPSAGIIRKKSSKRDRFIFPCRREWRVKGETMKSKGALIRAQGEKNEGQKTSVSVVICFREGSRSTLKGGHLAGSGPASQALIPEDKSLKIKKKIGLRRLGGRRTKKVKLDQGE